MLWKQWSPSPNPDFVGKFIRKNRRRWSCLTKIFVMITYNGFRYYFIQDHFGFSFKAFLIPCIETFFWLFFLFFFCLLFWLYLVCCKYIFGLQTSSYVFFLIYTLQSAYMYPFILLFYTYVYIIFFVLFCFHRLLLIIFLSCFINHIFSYYILLKYIILLEFRLRSEKQYNIIYYDINDSNKLHLYT